MIVDKPLFGYGYNSALYNDVSSRYNMDGISNGFIGTIIMFGIPMIIFVMIMTLKNTKRSGWNIPVLIVIVFFVMEQMTEFSFFFPVSLVFIFAFRRDSLRMNIPNIYSMHMPLKGGRSARQINE